RPPDAGSRKAGVRERASSQPNSSSGQVGDRNYAQAVFGEQLPVPAAVELDDVKASSLSQHDELSPAVQPQHVRGLFFVAVANDRPVHLHPTPISVEPPLF